MPFGLKVYRIDGATLNSTFEQVSRSNGLEVHIFEFTFDKGMFLNIGVSCLIGKMRFCQLC